MDISKGYVLKPFLLFRNKEIENAILRKLGLPPIHDIQSQIIGKGVAYLVGEEYKITSKNPDVQKLLDEKEQEIRDMVNDIESMAKSLKNEEFALRVKQEQHQMYLDVANEMEENRKIRKTWKKSERFDNEILSHFNKSILQHLLKMLKENNIQSKLREILNSKQDFELFLEYVPSSNVLVRLTYTRDEESSERSVQPNDIIDVAHLSGAVPYCDIVVMEKMFASICKRIKLDKKYDCQVLSSLKELNELI